MFQNALETNRVHVCEIYFYIEDGTIEIILTKQENSGISQGVFLRRSRVAKPCETIDSSWNDSGYSNYKMQYYGVDDLRIGNVLDIYSRQFHIVDCNGSTKRFMVENHGWTERELNPLPLPRDLFAESNREKMRRESGVPGVDRNCKMHDLKRVMESQLGKQISTTDRGMLLTPLNH